MKSEGHWDGCLVTFHINSLEFPSNILILNEGSSRSISLLIRTTTSAATRSSPDTSCFVKKGWVLVSHRADLPVPTPFWTWCGPRKIRRLPVVSWHHSLVYEWEALERRNLTPCRDLGFYFHKKDFLGERICEKNEPRLSRSRSHTLLGRQLRSSRRCSQNYAGLDVLAWMGWQFRVAAPHHGSPVRYSKQVVNASLLTHN